MMCKSIKEEELDNYCNGQWLAEPKKDGSRIVYRNGKFFTQNRASKRDSRDVTHKFPELNHEPMNVVLDGEIVAESGSFEDTGSRIHLEDSLGIRISAKKNPVIYWVFDIIEIEGESVEHYPLLKRKELLKTIDFENPRFEILPYTTEIKELWERIKKEKKEGIILKKIDSTYNFTKRSNDWLKCKYWKEDVVIVKEYEENPKGIRLTMDNGQGLQCAGYHAPPVKKEIDERGQARIEIQYLTVGKKADDSGDKVYRFPSFKRMI